jgi:hypothetical protein
MTAPRRGTGYKHGISPADFFSSESEKVKFNWFLFEFALELGHFIANNRPLFNQLARKGVGGDQIARFCIYFSKQMKGQILDRVSAKLPAVRMSYEEIEMFFPSLDDRLVDGLLTMAGKAWDSLLEMCVICPTRCISERNEIAPMFSDPFCLGHKSRKKSEIRARR